MRKIICRLRDRRGETYIQTAVGVLAAMFAVVIALNVFELLTLKQDLDYMAKETCEACCSYGQTGGEAEERLAELGEKTGLSPAVSYGGTGFFDGTGKVQYGERINVSLTYATYVKGLGVFRIPVTLTSSCSGLSRRYWKEER